VRRSRAPRYHELDKGSSRNHWREALVLRCGYVRTPGPALHRKCCESINFAPIVSPLVLISDMAGHHACMRAMPNSLCNARLRQCLPSANAACACVTWTRVGVLCGGAPSHHTTSSRTEPLHFVGAASANAREVIKWLDLRPRACSLN
jgi:hypothetical protein